MNILIVLAHPDKTSFNHAIAERVEHVLRSQNHEVILHDLHAEVFDPLLPACEFPRDAELPEEIKKYCAVLQNADGIVIVHPNWWGQPPAILKGWIDRVIRPGVAYEFLEGDDGEGVPNGLLKARFAIVFNTGNTEMVREKETFGDPLQLIWEKCVFGLCGVTDFYRKLFTIVITSTRQEREAWLDETEDIVRGALKNYE